MTPKFVAAVEAHFITQMTANFAAIPLFFENVPDPETVDVYAVLHVVSGDTFPGGIQKNSRSRNVGIIQIDVYTPKDQGAGEGRSVAFAAGNYFKRLRLTVPGEGEAVIKEPTVVGRGIVRGRHKQMATIPYYYDFIPV
jgi:hypothetical protein